jgi:hypothetical protein
MKKTVLLLLIILFPAITFAQDVIRLSEPVQETEAYEVFGSEIEVETLEPVTLSEVVDGEPGEITLVTSVKEVCAKKGCFFVAQDGDVTARITFKDYGFFIPTDSQGKEVVLVGDFSVKTLSEDQAKHYAEDAGEDPDKIEGEQKEYSVVATSIIVPKTK